MRGTADYEFDLYSCKARLPKLEHRLDECNRLLCWYLIPGTPDFSAMLTETRDLELVIDKIRARIHFLESNPKV